MMDRNEIHIMFYENGKIKDRKDPSQRVTRKIHWSDNITDETIKKVSESYGKTVQRLNTLPLIANLAYCGMSFIEAIDFWRQISNLTIEEKDKDLINESKQEIFSLIGYLCILKNKVIYNRTETITLCKSAFEFKSFKKLLKYIGIKTVDSKILSRAANLKSILSKSIGYDNTANIPYERLIAEINFQFDFFKCLADNICFNDNSDFVIYLLRYDLKKCKH